MFETLVFALALNLIGFGFAFRFKTDKLTDMSYALTFAGIALFGILRNEITLPKIVLFSLVCLWAVRLGSYLAYRIHIMGRDKRFDEMRGNFRKFLGFWVLQAITAWIVMVPVTFVLNSDTTTSSVLVWLGAIIALKGLAIEAIADMQKFRFSTNPTNKNKWIDSGLWQYSRHPNYLGEMIFWTGVYIAALTQLQGVQVYVSLVSPLFISGMLLFVSGIPLLEKSADKKWGTDKAYQTYKKRTSVLLILPKR